MQDSRHAKGPSDFIFQFKESLFLQDRGGILGNFVPLYPRDDVQTTLDHKQKELAVLFNQELSCTSKINSRAEPQVTLTFVDAPHMAEGAVNNMVNRSTTTFCSSMHDVPQRFMVRPMDLLSKLKDSVAHGAVGGCNLFVSGWF
jgi:hypothetical protein